MWSIVEKRAADGKGKGGRRRKWLAGRLARFAQTA